MKPIFGLLIASAALALSGTAASYAQQATTIPAVLNICPANSETAICERAVTVFVSQRARGAARNADIVQLVSAMATVAQDPRITRPMCLDIVRGIEVAGRAVGNRSQRRAIQILADSLCQNGFETAAIARTDFGPAQSLSPEQGNSGNSPIHRPTGGGGNTGGNQGDNNGGDTGGNNGGDTGGNNGGDTGGNNGGDTGGNNGGDTGGNNGGDTGGNNGGDTGGHDGGNGGHSGGNGGHNGGNGGHNGGNGSHNGGNGGHNGGNGGHNGGNGGHNGGNGGHNGGNDNHHDRDDNHGSWGDNHGGWSDNKGGNHNSRW